LKSKYQLLFKEQYDLLTSTNGLFFGETGLFGIQFITMIGVSIFAFVGTWILLKITDWIAPLRVNEHEEYLGLDLSQHGENL